MSQNTEWFDNHCKPAIDYSNRTGLINDEYNNNRDDYNNGVYEKDINIIKKFNTKDILLAALKIISRYHPIIGNIRHKLKPMWYDDIWWPNTIIQDLLPVIFKRIRKDVYRSWANDAYRCYSNCDSNYVADDFECKLCGEIIEVVVTNGAETYQPDYINPLNRHMESCKDIKKILRQSKSLGDFKGKIKEMAL